MSQFINTTSGEGHTILPVSNRGSERKNASQLVTRDLYCHHTYACMCSFTQWCTHAWAQARSHKHHVVHVQCTVLSVFSPSVDVRHVDGDWQEQRWQNTAQQHLLCHLNTTPATEVYSIVICVWRERGDELYRRNIRTFQVFFVLWEKKLPGSKSGQIYLV